MKEKSGPLNLRRWFLPNSSLTAPPFCLPENLLFRNPAVHLSVITVIMQYNQSAYY